jgi:hypothetical protein
MAAAVAACGHGGGTSMVPGGRDTSGAGRSASAVGTAAPSTSPSPTLYVAGNDRVVAYPLGASGTPTPVRTLFVHRLQQDGIVGIATNADTSLDVLQDFRNSPTGPGTPTAPNNFPDCRVVVFAANASGDAAAQSQFPCIPGTLGPGQPIGGARGIAIARGAASLGAIDYLESALPATGPPSAQTNVQPQPVGPSPQPGDFVQRSNEAGANNGILVVSEPQAKVDNGMAEATTGNIFVSFNFSGSSITKNASLRKPIAAASSANSCVAGTPGTSAAILNYSPGATGNASPFSTLFINGRITAGALATYPVTDPFQRVYAATCDTSGNSWVDEIVTQNFPSGTVSPNRSIGPFTQATVTALAVDAQGYLYVGLTDNSAQNLLRPAAAQPAGASTTNAVRVYSPNFANGSKLPHHSIENAVPVPENGTQRITGIAISQ